MSDAGTTRLSGTTWIMLAVLAWGCVLALGAYLFGGSHPLERAAIVLCITVAFLLMWGGALVMRRRGMETDQDVPPKKSLRD